MIGEDMRTIQTFKTSDQLDFAAQDGGLVFDIETEERIFPGDQVALLSRDGVRYSARVDDVDERTVYLEDVVRS